MAQQRLFARIDDLVGFGGPQDGSVLAVGDLPVFDSLSNQIGEMVNPLGRFLHALLQLALRQRILSAAIR